MLGRSTVGEWTSRMEAFGAQLGKIFPSAGNIAASTEQQNMHHTKLIITIKPLLQTTSRLIGSKILDVFLLSFRPPAMAQEEFDLIPELHRSVLMQISFKEQNAS